MLLRHGISSSQAAPRKCRLFRSLPTSCGLYGIAGVPAPYRWPGEGGKKREMRVAAERDAGLRPGTARLPRHSQARPWVPTATLGLPSPHPLPVAQRRHSARCLPAPKTRGPFVSICGTGLNGDIVPSGPLRSPAPPHHRQPPTSSGPPWPSLSAGTQLPSSPRVQLSPATVLLPWDGSWPGCHLQPPELTSGWGALQQGLGPAPRPGRLLPSASRWHCPGSTIPTLHPSCSLPLPSLPAVSKCLLYGLNGSNICSPTLSMITAELPHCCRSFPPSPVPLVVPGLCASLGTPPAGAEGCCHPRGSHPAMMGLCPGKRVGAPGRAQHHPAPCLGITPWRGRKGAIVCPDPVLALPTALKAGSWRLMAVTALHARSVVAQASGGHTGIQRPRAWPAAELQGTLQPCPLPTRISLGFRARPHRAQGPSAEPRAGGQLLPHRRRLPHPCLTRRNWFSPQR